MSQAVLTHVEQQCLGLLLSDTAPQYINTLRLSCLKLIYDPLPSSTSVIISEPINQPVGQLNHWPPSSILAVLA